MVPTVWRPQEAACSACAWRTPEEIFMHRQPYALKKGAYETYLVDVSNTWATNELGESHRRKKGSNPCHDLTSQAKIQTMLY